MSSHQTDSTTMSSTITQNLLDSAPPRTVLSVDHESSSSQNRNSRNERSRVDDEEAARMVKTGVRKLIGATVFAVIFMIVEFFAGYLANSLAVMTDAAHLLADVAGFAISLFAIYLAQRPATMSMTYGMARAEVLGALVSIMTIWGITFVLVYEAVQRTRTLIKDDKKLDIDGRLMFIVACGGLVVNIILLCILGTHGHSHMGQKCEHNHSHSKHSHGHHEEGHDEGHDAHHPNEHGHQHAHGHNHSHAHSHSDSQPEEPCNQSTLIIHEDNHGHAHNHTRPLFGGHKKHEDNARLLSLPVADNDPPAPKRRNHEENLNVRAAYIHALGDLIQNAGVMVAGALIWWQSNYNGHRLWQLADPVCTFFFSLLVLYTTFKILQTSIMVLMEGIPKHIKFSNVLADIQAVKGIESVHDLHIWSLTSGTVALTVHARITTNEIERVLNECKQVLADEHGIKHCTVQLEPVGSDIGCHCLPQHNSVMGDSCSSTTTDVIPKPNTGAASRVDVGRPAPVMQTAPQQEPQPQQQQAPPRPHGHGHSHGGKACHGHGHAHASQKQATPVQSNGGDSSTPEV